MRPVRTLALSLAAVFVAQLASFSPASATLVGGNGFIAFETGRTDELDIWRMLPDGSHLKRLTTSNKEDRSPAFGYMGIVFTRNAIGGGPGDIFRMAFNGTDKTRLTNTPAISEVDPAWSPAGDIPLSSMRIVFSSSRTGNGDLYTVRASDGGNLTRITFNKHADFEPDWGGKAHLIAFVSTRTGHGDIYAMKANGTDLRRVTRNAAIDSQPSWMPESNKIAFVSDRDGDNEIFTINADGTGLKKLTNNTANDQGPVWAPECPHPAGCRIAFMSNREKSSFEIYTMKPDGTNVHRITHNDFVDGFPTWEPLAG
jgi:Tol biopolymer transport system component